MKIEHIPVLLILAACLFAAAHTGINTIKKILRGEDK